MDRWADSPVSLTERQQLVRRSIRDICEQYAREYRLLRSY